MLQVRIDVLVEHFEVSIVNLSGGKSSDFHIGTFDDVEAARRSAWMLAEVLGLATVNEVHHKCTRINRGRADGETFPRTL